MKNVFLYGCLLFISRLGLAQAPEPRHHNFTHYTEDSGLVSYQVNATAQDRDGYIWIATNEGLQRFDGIRYKTFRPLDGAVNSLPAKGILQIISDSHGQLWLLTTDGQVGTFNTRTFAFSQASVQRKYANPQATLRFQQRLITDEFGNVFLLLPGRALLRYNRDKHDFSEAHNFFRAPPGLPIMDFVQQPGTQKYWMCTGGSGFSVYNHETGQWSDRVDNREKEPLITRHIQGINPYKLFFDSRGRVWYASLEENLPYLYGFDTGSGTHFLERYGFGSQVPRYHEVNDFLEQQDGSIWISGVFILAKYLETDRAFQQVYNGYLGEQSIDYVVITSIREDRERNIWLGTANNGLYRFNPAEEFFRTIRHASKLRGNIGSGAPLDFIQDRDGSLLTAVWGDKVYRYDRNLHLTALDIKGYSEEHPKPVVAMSPSQWGGVIWMASADGIFEYNQMTRSADFHTLPELKSRIRDIREDSNGILWLGLQEHGVYTWDPSNGTHDLVHFPGIPQGRIHDIKVDREGMVWVATYGSGAYMVNPHTGQVIHHFSPTRPAPYTLPEAYVSSILDYNDSLVVIGTRSNILVYNRIRRSLNRLTTNSTVSGVVQSLERDRDGYLWFSTSSGLYRLKPETNVFIKFNRKDGIGNDYFIIGASHTLPDGRMAFGASSSMVVFNPADVRISAEYPHIQITDFRVMNHSLPVDSLLGLKTIQLAADQNSIAVDLSTMSHLTQYVVRYMLQGLDADWRTADDDYQLVYSYLPPGDFKLVIVPVNVEGVEANKPLTLNISVAPPFWKTWWFLSLLALVIVTTLYFLDSLRMQRKEALQKMRADIAANLHQEVNAALQNINILSEMASRKAVSDPQKSAQFIEQIHSKSHNMLFALDDMLWSISPENDTMEKTIDRMKEYIAALNNRHNAGMALLIDRRVKSLKLNMQIRYEAFILFKEIVKALLSSRARNCGIHVTIDKTHLLYSIELDNKCCEVEQLHHIEHRQDLAKRLELLGASLRVQVHSSHSVTELKIPLTPAGASWQPRPGFSK